MERRERRWAIVDGKPVSTCTVGQVSGTLTTYLRRKARERKLAFELTEQYLWDLFLKQGGRCQFSGVPITLTTKRNKQNNIDRTILTASLDRIDSSQPYIEGNVQWVHKTVNIMKQSLSDAEFVDWCPKISIYANPERSTGNGKQDVPVNVQRLGGEEPTNNPPTSAQHPTFEGEEIV